MSTKEKLEKKNKSIPRIPRKPTYPKKKSVKKSSTNNSGDITTDVTENDDNQNIGLYMFDFETSSLYECLNGTSLETHIPTIDEYKINVIFGKRGENNSTVPIMINGEEHKVSYLDSIVKEYNVMKHIKLYKDFPEYRERLSLFYTDKQIDYINNVPDNLNDFVFTFPVLEENDVIWYVNFFEISLVLSKNGNAAHIKTTLDLLKRNILVKLLSGNHCKTCGNPINSATATSTATASDPEHPRKRRKINIK